jgi:hypothetical protein
MPSKSHLLIVWQRPVDVVKAEIDQLLTIDHGAPSVMSLLFDGRPPVAVTEYLA